MDLSIIKIKHKQHKIVLLLKSVCVIKHEVHSTFNQRSWADFLSRDQQLLSKSSTFTLNAKQLYGQLIRKYPWQNKKPKILSLVFPLLSFTSCR